MIVITPFDIKLTFAFYLADWTHEIEGRRECGDQSLGDVLPQVGDLGAIFVCKHPLAPGLVCFMIN